MLTVFAVLSRRGSDVVVRVEVGELLPCIGDELLVLEEEGILWIVIIGKTLFFSFKNTFHDSVFRDDLLRESLQFFLRVDHVGETRKTGKLERISFLAQTIEGSLVFDDAACVDQDLPRFLWLNRKELALMLPPSLHSLVDR